MAMVEGEGQAPTASIVLQCLLHMPQLESALRTAEIAAKVRNLGQNWGMDSKDCNTPAFCIRISTHIRAGAGGEEQPAAGATLGSDEGRGGGNPAAPGDGPAALIKSTSRHHFASQNC